MCVCVGGGGAHEREQSGTPAADDERRPPDSPVCPLPLGPCTQVRIPARELEAWAAGAPAIPAAAAAAAADIPAAELRTLKLFSLNDYLGLSTHADVRRASAAAALACGSGPRSSALVGGYTTWHRELEGALAALKGTEEALLFPTGYAANLAVAAALCVGGGVAVYSDELNHASIVDGTRLARRDGAQVHVYRHNDLEQLDAMLAACPSGELARRQCSQLQHSCSSSERPHPPNSDPACTRPPAPAPGMRKLVLTDSLFSMDGDYADLRGLARLKARHGFLLGVDEAHATLVCGARGGGAAEAQGVAEHVDLHVGTLRCAATGR